MAEQLPSAGDTAQIVETCGCAASTPWLWRYLVVTRITVEKGRCETCGFESGLTEYARFAYDGDEALVLRRWLQRIPPLAELEQHEQKQEQPA